MVLTRKQTRELQERELSTLTSQCNPLDLDSLDSDPGAVLDTSTGATPPRCVLQTNNTMTTKGMQGSARKGLQSWPLGSSKEELAVSVEAVAGGARDGTGRESLASAVGVANKHTQGVANKHTQGVANKHTQGVQNQAMDVAAPEAEAAADPRPPRATPDAAHVTTGSEPAVNLPTGPEPTDIAQVDLYPSRASFVPYATEELPTTTSSILENVAATNWLVQVQAMNALRRLAAHHRNECDILLTGNSDRVFQAIIKAIRSPRSNVSKSAIMTVRDLFELAPRWMGAELEKDAQLQNMNGMFMVLLSKAASNDKRFVVDEATGALDCMCEHVDASVVIGPVLSGATEHKNPKVRGRCFVLLRSLVTNSQDVDGLLLSGEGLVRAIVAACDRGITDNTPEARECAREVIRAVFKDGGSEGLRRYMEAAMAGRDEAEEARGGGGESVQEVDTIAAGDATEMVRPSVLERFITDALGNNRGKAVLLLEKCKLSIQ